jgi:hypothetical protein
VIVFVALAVAGCGTTGDGGFGNFDPTATRNRMEARYGLLATALEQRDADAAMVPLSPDFKHDGITRADVRTRLGQAASEYANVDVSLEIKNIRIQGKTAYVTTAYRLAGDVVAEPGVRKSGEGEIEVRWCHELNDWYITGNLQNGSGGPPPWPF